MKLPTTAILTLGISPVIGFALHAAPVDASAVVKNVSGTVWKSSAGGIPQPILAGTTVKKGETLTTSVDSTLEVALGSAQTITLAGNSALRIVDLTVNGGDVLNGQLTLIRGTMQAKAGTLSQGSRIDVQMPNGSVTALADKADAEWNAVYDARSGNIHNLASGERGLALAGALTAGTQTHAVTVKSGERFVMPTFTELPANVELASAVSAIPSRVDAADLLGSVSEAASEVETTPATGRSSRVGLAALPRPVGKSRK